MERFWRKSLMIFILAMVCYIGNSNKSLAKCTSKYTEISSTGTEINITRENGQQACYTDPTTTIVYLLDCQDNNFKEKTCGMIAINPKITCEYLNAEKTQAKCSELSETKDCDLKGVHRKPGETACFKDLEYPGFGVYQCMGLSGNFMMLHNCVDQCEDPVNQPAKCVDRRPCTKDGKTRNYGDSACFTTIQTDPQTGLKTTYYEQGTCEGKNFKFKTCEKGCEELSTVRADCINNEDFVCNKNDIKRKLGKTACLDGEEGNVYKCEKTGYVLDQDCLKEDKICISETDGNGRCDSKSEENGTCKCTEVSIGSGAETSCNQIVFSDMKCDMSKSFPVCKTGAKCLEPSCSCQPYNGGGTTTTNAFCDKMGPESENPSIDTALGCVPIEPNKFIQWLLPYVFGITGGISFLLMVYSFILMATSGGDPKKVQGAKETITAAIVGLLLSVFSLFILRLISVNILRIPGIN